MQTSGGHRNRTGISKPRSMPTPRETCSGSAPIVVQSAGVPPWQADRGLGRAEERDHHLAAVRVPREREVDAERHGGHEVGGVRDHDAVIGRRRRGQDPAQDLGIALSAPPAGQPRDAEGAPVAERDPVGRIGETPDLRPREHGGAGWTDVSFGGEDAEGSREADAPDEVAQVGRRALLGGPSHRVLHVVAGQHDEVGPVAQTAEEGVLFVGPDRRRLDVRDVQDAEGPAAGPDGVMTDLQHRRLDEVGAHVDREDGQRDRGQRSGAKHAPAAAVARGEEHEEQDALREDRLAQQAQADRPDMDAADAGAGIRGQGCGQRGEVDVHGQHPDVAREVESPSRRGGLATGGVPPQPGDQPDGRKDERVEEERGGPEPRRGHAPRIAGGVPRCETRGFRAICRFPPWPQRLNVVARSSRCATRPGTSGRPTGPSTARKRRARVRPPPAPVRPRRPGTRPAAAGSPPARRRS